MRLLVVQPNEAKAVHHRTMCCPLSSNYLNSSPCFRTTCPRAEDEQETSQKEKKKRRRRKSKQHKKWEKKKLFGKRGGACERCSQREEQKYTRNAKRCAQCTHMLNSVAVTATRHGAVRERTVHRAMLPNKSTKCAKKRRLNPHRERFRKEKAVLVSGVLLCASTKSSQLESGACSLCWRSSQRC